MKLKMMNAGALAVGLCVNGAFSQMSIPDEPRWALIGDPGNPDTTDEDSVAFTQPPVGSVDYLYRIWVLEMTVNEQVEFVEAYAPFYFQNHPNLHEAEWAFTGDSILLTRTTIQYSSQGLRAANMGWEYAARYINWLHHGKVNEAWAFETGVFDTSTFEPDDQGEYHWQETHSPEARYWFPTTDEWTKAAYWDPDKLGEGIGGYWRYPNSTMNALRPELLPEDGGQRNSGRDFSIFPLDVASFPNERSPWGLLDLAGGEQEWLEYRPPNPRHDRATGGTWFMNIQYNEPYSPHVVDRDHVTVFDGLPASVPAGVRLATTEFHPADLNHDGVVNYFDISIYIQMFSAGDSQADLRLDGQLDIDDVRVFLGLMNNP